LQYLTDHSDINFNFAPATIAEVTSLILALRDSAPGYDGIPIKLFKDNITTLAKIVTHICNQSMVTGVFPEKLMIARITCIYKSGNPQHVNNYRPVSVLVAFSRILEKLVTVRLASYFNQNGLFSPSQYGFRTKLSTVDAVQAIVNALYDAFDAGESAVGVFLDLAKAFDTLDRDKLFTKLSSYGVRGTALLWFRSYFAARKQFVSYGGAESALLPVEYGVAQGSIVGPVLFIIYINDIVKCSNDLKFVIYADDTNAFISSSNHANNVTSVNRELVQVSQWMRANCLTLNVDKSQYVVFHRRRRKLDNFNDAISIDGIYLARVETVKFLGIILDHNLLWKDHVNYVVRKLSRFVPIMYNIRSHLTVGALKLIYNALIYPNLIYCNSVWGACCEAYLSPLRVLHKKIVKVMLFKSRYEHSAPLFKSLNMLTLDHVNNYMCAIFIYKSICNDSNDEWFSLYVSNYNTRLSTLSVLSMPNINSTHSRQSVRWVGCRFWNCLPLELRDRELSFNSFKFRLKKYLLNLQSAP
jgi:hypothetical protein